MTFVVCGTVSTKMLNVITPSLPSSSKDEASLVVDEDVQLRSVNLSATLQKLYLWEKKLFDEVKVYNQSFSPNSQYMTVVYCLIVRHS